MDASPCRQPAALQGPWPGSRSWQARAFWRRSSPEDVHLCTSAAADSSGRTHADRRGRDPPPSPVPPIIGRRAARVLAAWWVFWAWVEAVQLIDTPNPNPNPNPNGCVGDARQRLILAGLVP
jgi:hypothetical protein